MIDIKLLRVMAGAGCSAEVIINFVEIIQNREQKVTRLSGRRWLPLTEQVFERDGYFCSYCLDASGPFAIDHIIPISRGGSNEMNNLTVACRSCNSSKRDRTPHEWVKDTGMVLPAWWDCGQ